MKNIKLLSILGMAFLIGLSVGCKDEDPAPTPDPGTKTTYDADAAIILNTSCATVGCHITGAAIGSLNGYTDAKAFAEFGKMMNAVNHVAGTSPMPKNGAKLSDENIATLQAWVDDGLLEN